MREAETKTQGKHEEILRENKGEKRLEREIERPREGDIEITRKI